MRLTTRILIATAATTLLCSIGIARLGMAADNAVKVSAADLTATVTLSAAHAAPGQELGVTVDFTLGPGWHVYGEPLPDGYIATKVMLANELVASQSMNFPKATPVEFAAIGEKLPAYKDRFRATGKLKLKPGLKAGDAEIQGTIQFQECNDSICKLPKTVAFALPLKID